MGYAYYIKMQNKILAITTDLGLFIFSLEEKWLNYLGIIDLSILSIHLNK